LWILGEKLQCGFDVDLRSILLKQEDVEVCELLGADIYRIDASGGWLVASGKAEDALRIFRKENIPASVIGICRAGLQRQLRLGDDIRFLEEP
jgi:hydrogenase maturation factor